MDNNMIGAYGPWAAGIVGDGPANVFPQSALSGSRPRRLAAHRAREVVCLLAAARYRPGSQSSDSA